MHMRHLVLILSPSSHMLGACHRRFPCPALSPPCFLPQHERDYPWVVSSYRHPLGMVYKTIILWNCSLFIYTRQEVLDNEVEVKALKSFIHAESLTSPQHPFYDPKAEGVEMYMGKYHKLEHATPPSPWAQEPCPTENHVSYSLQSRWNTCDIGSKLWDWSIGLSRCLIPTTS